MTDRYALPASPRCRECGVMVANTVEHDAFHDRLEQAVQTVPAALTLDEYVQSFGTEEP